MMNIAKPLLAITIGLSFLIPNSSVFANNSKNITEDQRKVFKETFQFSDKHINDLSDEAIKKYLSYEDPIVSKKEEYFEITYNKHSNPKVEELSQTEAEEKANLLTRKEEKNAQNKVDALGSDVEKNDILKLETWLIKNKGDKEAQASARFEFLSTPDYSDFHQDILAIGTSQNLAIVKGSEDFVFKYDEFKFTREYDRYGHPIYDWVPEKEKSKRADQRDSGGYAFKFDLPDTGNRIRDMRGYMKVDVTPRSKKWRGEVYDIYSHYLHSTSSVKIGFSIPLGGSFEIDKGDAIKLTGHVQEEYDK
ncbi:MULTISPECIES: hypothetical protein [Brevibacillus]